MQLLNRYFTGLIFCFFKPAQKLLSLVKTNQHLTFSFANIALTLFVVVVVVAGVLNINFI